MLRWWVSVSEVGALWVLGEYWVLLMLAEVGESVGNYHECCVVVGPGNGVGMDGVEG